VGGVTQNTHKEKALKLVNNILYLFKNVF